MKRFILGFTLLVANVGFAHFGEMDRLQFLNEGREAANRKFLAVIEEGAAKNDTTLAKFSYDLVLKLSRKNATSAFELSNAKLKVLNCEFAEKRAKFHIDAADTYFKLAELRRVAVETGKEMPRDQAKHHLSLCVKRHALILELDKALVPFAAEVKMQYEADERLKNQGHMSADEFKKMEVFYSNVTGLVAVTKAEIAESAKAKTLAEKEAN